MRAVDPSRPSILAAREFGGQYRRWQFDRAQLLANGWLEAEDLWWQPDEALRATAAWDAEKDRAWSVIRGEIEQLQMLMQDDRERYLAEIDVQADGLADYVIGFIGTGEARRPWTIEYISCALAIGNIAYMYYKAHFKRVRPSVLCPGLVPPFGPPEHPAFPSGHSFLGHLIALLLLEIPALARRYGIFPIPPNPAGPGGTRPAQNSLVGRGEIPSPLLWLAQRLAKNRERLGVHYASDSSASRHLAAGMWWALLHDAAAATRIDCPTLRSVRDRAIAEWPMPTPWP